MRIHRRPHPEHRVRADRIQHIIDTLLAVERAAPMHRGDGARMREIRAVELDILRADRQPTPDFDETVILAD